ncbi:MAG TPA: GYF domain-containing protein, partial [Myxococcota bacterium]|nr:GYF domain-containing protein [Myxococcota bacterium]
MTDIWSGVSVNLSSTSSGGEWLYRVGQEVRGPVAFESVVSKLLGGELTPKTQVAREGGDWHPIAQVAAFEPHVLIYQKQASKKARKVARTIALILGVIVLIAAGIAGYWLWIENEHKKVLAEVGRLRSETDLERQRRILESGSKMGLVALVSLGTESDVKIKGAAKKPGTTSTKHKGTTSGTPGTSSGPSEDEMVLSCKLSQNDIFGTLKKHLAKINVCVEDEKGRDAANLPSQLELEFVVKPTGKVVDFHINDRHYRTGPMNNCM